MTILHDKKLVANFNVIHDDKNHDLHYQLQQDLEHLCNPLIRVVPEDDWSKIKAIWIPFFHHDYHNTLETAQKIIISEKTIDQFGTIQGYLSASNENYTPYLTTFFNPLLTCDQVIEAILQADANIQETIVVVTDLTSEKIIRKKVIGLTSSGMKICIIKNFENNIIDAFPIFGPIQS